MAHQSLPKQQQADNLGLCLKAIMKMFAAGIRSHHKSVVTGAQKTHKTAVATIAS
jgi:hypothetical protein